ncbi:MAG: DUF1622 domain-containing protein [Thermoanaerobaculia bacterium]
MTDLVQQLAEWSAALVEAIGLAIITVLSLYSLGFAAVRLARRDSGIKVFRETRHRLARGILLGLEFLVAADIVHTVAVDLTFTSVGVLAAIVAVRTFLSFTLEVELTGHWPWRSGEDGAQGERTEGRDRV